MAGNSSDVLMKVVNQGAAMASESMTEFARGTIDSLRLGFQAGLFFELESFSYSVGSAAALARRIPEAPAPTTDEEGNPILVVVAAPVQPTTPKTDFVDIQPVSFTRRFDIASPQMFAALVASKTLDSVVVLKRKAAGSKNAGEAYLRLDFTQVLLTDLQWQEAEDIVVESGSFIYRKLEIQYRPQQANGSLGAIVRSSWPP